MAGAGYKTFTAGSILTATEVNTYLMEQATMVFATTAARDAAITAPSEGMTVYITADDSVTYYDGSAWKVVQYQGALPTWTPAVTQNGARTSTISQAVYQVNGRIVTAIAALTITQVGAAGNAIAVGGLPIAANTTAGIVGSYWYFRNGGNFYTGSVAGATSTSVQLTTHDLANYVGITPSFATANNDVLRLHITYAI